MKWGGNCFAISLSKYNFDGEKHLKNVFHHYTFIIINTVDKIKGFCAKK